MKHDATIGERIAHYRRRRGLTQQVCGNLVGRSESWMSQVERGLIQVDGVAAVLRLAVVLKVDLAKLLGPALDLPPNGGSHDDLPRGVPAVSRAIIYPDRFARMAFGGPVDLDDLAARVERARRARRASRLTELAMVLPDLIVAARIATQDSPGSARAWGLLSHGYRLAGSLLRQFGECHLSWVAAERAVAAAERADDEVLMALGAWNLGSALFAVAGHQDAADIVVQDAASLLEVGIGAALPERVAVFGELRLATGVLTATANDVAASREAIRDAARVAELLPEGHIDPWTAFCPTEVAFSDIQVWVELGDPVEALRVADRTDFDALPLPQRQARAWARVAQAHGLRRKDGPAAASLLEAERIAPEEVRYNRSVRELVGVLLRRERKSATPGLRALARRIGVE
ncbi:MAG: helix-turn-helix domain-containing protein [Egibacteraceae bacterium]